MNTPATPVRRFTDAQERAKLAALQADPPPHIVVVSDLHLGMGLDARTGRYSRRENFFADEAFGRFLDSEIAHGKERKLLVLNGDIFDFLRIDDWPSDQAKRDQWTEDLARLEAAAEPTDVTSHEKHFGLHTDPGKCLYKFKIIARGHTAFFAGLLEWLRAGGLILYVKGNHDVEQHWPLIRRAFRDQILLSAPQQAREAAAQAVSDQVVFADTAASFSNLYIEHGHNYEALTRVDEPAERKGPPSRLNLPLGSFVNRYIINQMEREEPFLDNIKPVTDALRTMVRRNPIAVLDILWNSTAFLLNALLGRRARHTLLALVILAAAFIYVVPVLVLGTVVAYFASADVRQLIVGLPWLSSPLVRVGGSVVGTVAPVLVALVRGAWHALRRPRPFEDEFAAGVYKLLRQNANGRVRGWNMQYAVLGHTHEQDMQYLPPKGVVGPSVLYLNSGTWTPLWPQDRPDLVGRVRYSFLRFRRANGEYRHESLVWDDEVGRARPAQVLAST